MEKKNRYINRDISWLSFNMRVLEEAADKSLPLYERIKFLAIYSSNLEEYYKIRVANYRNITGLPKVSRKKLAFEPTEILQKINRIVTEQSQLFDNIFTKVIIPELKKNNIILYQNINIRKEHEEYVRDYFSLEVLPHIQPVLLELGGGIFSFLQDNFTYLAIKMYKKTKKNKVPKRPLAKYAVIKVPTNYLPRFVLLPKIEEKNYIIFLDDIIKFHLDMLFPGYLVDSCYEIKLSRDADLFIEDEYQGDLAQKIKKHLSRRKIGAPSRFVYNESIPDDFLKRLMKMFKLSKDDLVAGSMYSGLSDLFTLPNPLSPKLERENITHLKHKELEKYQSMFKAIKNKDWILHFPYQSYKYVLNFLSEAAVDPRVEKILATQYRVATNSAVVSALISAARNGKKVTVFVEVKARFDEENNLKFAEEMKKAGIKVISSLPEIKVHAKVALVLRKSNSDGKMKGYSYLSTGNFNEKTAKLYADEGLFTYNQDIAKDIQELFFHLEKPSYKPKFKKLLIGQFNMTQTFVKLVEREIKHAKAGCKAYMILKMNGLECPKMIELLYNASEAGVKIDLLVRGVCCLVPQQSFSKNIRVIRIVDRFLEHARIFVFYNNGNNDTYISSADWMKRNLYRRIETTVPILNKEIKNEIIDILKIQLDDNVKASLLDSKVKNIRRKPEDSAKIIAQTDIYKYLENKTK